MVIRPYQSSLGFTSTVVLAISHISWAPDSWRIWTLHVVHPRGRSMRIRMYFWAYLFMQLGKAQWPYSDRMWLLTSVPSLNSTFILFIVPPWISWKVHIFCFQVWLSLPPWCFSHPFPLIPFTSSSYLNCNKFFTGHFAHSVFYLGSSSKVLAEYSSQNIIHPKVCDLTPTRFSRLTTLSQICQRILSHGK